MPPGDDTPTKNPTGIETLEVDVLRHIVDMLDPRSLVSLCGTSCFFLYAVSDIMYSTRGTAFASSIVTHRPAQYRSIARTQHESDFTGRTDTSIYRGLLTSCASSRCILRAAKVACKKLTSQYLLKTTQTLLNGNGMVMETLDAPVFVTMPLSPLCILHSESNSARELEKFLSMLVHPCIDKRPNGPLTSSRMNFAQHEVVAMRKFGEYRLMWAAMEAGNIRYGRPASMATDELLMAAGARASHLTKMGVPSRHPIKLSNCVGLIEMERGYESVVSATRNGSVWAINARSKLAAEVMGCVTLYGRPAQSWYNMALVVQHGPFKPEEEDNVGRTAAWFTCTDETYCEIILRSIDPFY